MAYVAQTKHERPGQLLALWGLFWQTASISECGRARPFLLVFLFLI